MATEPVSTLTVRFKSMSKYYARAMAKDRLSLVVPRPLFNTYTPAQKKWPLSVEDFCEHVELRQRRKLDTALASFSIAYCRLMADQATDTIVRTLCWRPTKTILFVHAYCTSHRLLRKLAECYYADRAKMLAQFEVLICLLL